jgi:hypothetical protein
LAKALLEIATVARRQHQRIALRRHLDNDHGWPGRAAQNHCGLRQAGVIDDRRGNRKARRPRNRGEVDAFGRVRCLHPGLAVALVVDHCYREVHGLPCRNRRDRAQAHQHLAVASDDKDAAQRLCER